MAVHAPAAADTDFARDVRPILERRCLRCHGAQDAHAGLRLVNARAVRAGGVSGPAVVPGDPDASYLVQRLRGQGDEDRMPAKDEALGTEEIDVVVRWIREGAPLGDEAPVARAPRLRRITDAEYRNTVASLFGGLAFRTPLPPDDRVGPFTNNAASLVNDTLLRQYQFAAEEIAAKVTTTPRLLPAACTSRTASTRACAEALVAALGAPLHRRPLSDEEHARYLRLHASIAGRYGRTGGTRAVLETMLQSAPFLYHVEIGGTDGRLGDFELADRLATFLWRQAPDQELLAAAASGRLRDGDGIAAQARRMLADERARPMLHLFFEQLLRVDRLRTANKNRQEFPEFERLRQTMLDETYAFVDEVVWSGGGTVDGLLTAPFGSTGGPLSALYAGSPRAGLLTQAAFLAAHAGNTHASAVQRGVTIRRNLLCQDLPPPPPGTNMDPKLPRLQQQPCAKCHTMIDPVGQGLDAYDAIGRYRPKQEADAAAPGRILALDGATVEFQGPQALSERLAGSRQYHRCMATQWLRFGLGRPDDERDGDSLDRLEAALEQAGGDVRALIVAVTQLDEFARVSP